MTQFNYEQSIWGRGSASLRYSDPAAFRLWRSLNWLKDLPVGSKMLEVGTGAGQFIRAFKKYNPKWECFGTDISVNALNEARQVDDGVKYDLSQGDKLPYEDNYFSAVLIFDVLEHVDNPQNLVKEIYRILQPGGKFYCFVPCEGDKLSFWYWLRNSARWGKLTEKYAGHINHWSRRQWLDLFRKNNFKVENVNYSEHFMGQILGLVAFYLMNHSNKDGGQINNEQFFTNSDKQSGLLTSVKKFVNTWVYWESRLGKKIPSPNIHVLLKK